MVWKRQERREDNRGLRQALSKEFWDYTQNNGDKHRMEENKGIGLYASLYWLTLDLWLAKDNRFLNPKSSYKSKGKWREHPTKDWKIRSCSLSYNNSFHEVKHYSSNVLWVYTRLLSFGDWFNHLPLECCSCLSLFLVCLCLLSCVIFLSLLDFLWFLS